MLGGATLGSIISRQGISAVDMLRPVIAEMVRGEMARLVGR